MSDPHAHTHVHPHAAAAVHHPARRCLTVRATSGLSGDMMLSGLAALAGYHPPGRPKGDTAPLGGSEQSERGGVTDSAGLEALVAELNLPALAGCLKLEARAVQAIAGVGCRIELPVEHAHRTLPDILALIAASAMPDAAKARANAAFRLLAEAEAAVHGQPVEAVHFHEVGALDSILDTCLVCRLFTRLDVDRFVCSPLPLADGAIRAAHGLLPSPAPAVLRLLEGVPVCAFPGAGETVTPTALSLLKALGAEFGGWPTMTVRKTVISYGQKVFADAPNGALWALGEAP